MSNQCSGFCSRKSLKFCSDNPKKVIRREILGNTVGENDKMCVAMAELSKIFPAADIRDNI